MRYDHREHGHISGFLTPGLFHLQSCHPEPPRTQITTRRSGVDRFHQEGAGRGTLCEWDVWQGGKQWHGGRICEAVLSGANLSSLI